ncbi:MAG: class I SAM-dependent methyltransferase [Candidatus Ryanbacteria bacterium]|nr:class I SAM-dependent methyltransferase [Candidatus Ryanbacteria bacterium]
MVRDYRDSHISREKSRRYEEDIYRKNSYDDALWWWEQGLLKTEINILKGQINSISALDFGCGTGRITAVVEQMVDNSVGVDIADSMLEYARTKLTRTELIFADLTKNDVLKGREFQLITAFRIFLNSSPALRHEILTVLAPKLTCDGRMIFNMHGNIWSQRVFTKIYFWLRGHQLNTSSYRHARHMIVPHGFVIERFYGFGVIPKIFYRIFGARSMYALDRILSVLPLMKYISFDLVFVCKKS